MKRCSYCGAEYPDDAVMCAFDHTPFDPGNSARSQAHQVHLTPGQRVFFRTLAVVFLSTLLAAALMALFIPGKFRSTAEVSVDDTPPDPYPELSGPHILPPDFLPSEFRIIKSHEVLSKAVDALNLRDVWGKKFNRGKPLSSARAEAILRRNIDLSLVQNTKIIDIQGLSGNPDEATQLANGVAGAYRDFNESRAPKTRWTFILGPAVAGLRPFRPNRPLIIVLGVIIGIVFGSIAAALSTHITASWKSSPDF